MDRSAAPYSADMDVHDPSDDEFDNDGDVDHDDEGPAVDDLAFIAEHAAVDQPWAFTADPRQGVVVAAPFEQSMEEENNDAVDSDDGVDNDNGGNGNMPEEDPVSSDDDDDSTDSADASPAITKGNYAALKGEVAWLTEEEEGNAPKGPPRTKHEVRRTTTTPVGCLQPTHVCSNPWQVDPALVDVVDVGDPLVAFFDPSDLSSGQPPSSSATSSSSSSSSTSTGALMVCPRRHSTPSPRLQRPHCLFPRCAPPPGRPRRGGPGAVPPGCREHHRRPGTPYFQVRIRPSAPRLSPVFDVRRGSPIPRHIYTYIYAAR